MHPERFFKLSLTLACIVTIAGCLGSRTPMTGPGAPVGQHSAAGAVILNEDLTARQIFPADNWWNLDVHAAPLDPQSSAYIDFLSSRSAANPTAVRHLHPDFGPSPYGIPYVSVSGSQALRRVAFVDYPGESDTGAVGRPAGYPIPDEAFQLPDFIEGAVPGGGPDGDRHLLVIDRDRWLLFETWATQWNPNTPGWEAGSGATFNLATNARRTEGSTSADAAGLAIFPGLIRADEVFGPGEIRHAFRFTSRGSNGYVWPASHQAGIRAGALPMGARLRLKAGKDISSFAPEVQKIFRAMKSYGLILADNGSDMYIQGTMDARWNNDVLNPAFGALTADDFEVVALGWRPQTTSVPCACRRKDLARPTPRS